MSEYFVYDTDSIKAVSVLYVIYFVIVLGRSFYLLKTQGLSKSENESQFNTSQSDLRLVVALHGLSFIAIFSLAYVFKVWILAIIISVLHFARIGMSAAESIRLVCQQSKKEQIHFPIIGRVTMFIISMYFFGLSCILADYAERLSLQGDICIILLMVVINGVQGYSLISVIGLLISEIAIIFHCSQLWKRVDYFKNNTILLRELSILPIWNKMTEKVTCKRRIYRIIAYTICFISAFIMDFCFTMIFLMQYFFEACLSIISSIIQVLSFCLEEFYVVSDKRYIQLFIRLSIIFALVATECKLLYVTSLHEQSRQLYEYVSGVVLIPLVLTQLTSIKNKVEKYEIQSEKKYN